MELPLDLVEELLMRLHVKAIMRFQCVSKHWHRLISDPNFPRRYQSRHHNIMNGPKGFFYHRNRPEFLSSSPCMPGVGSAKFIYTSNSCKQREELKSLDYLHEFGYTMATSKGLVLLSRNPMEYHVYDLVSKKHLKLPKTLKKYPYVSIGFMCKENTKYENHKNYLNFTVVRIEYSGYASSTHKVETYTSETGKWRKSIMKADLMFRLGPHYVAKVIGGVFYWKEFLTNRIVAYNPDDPKGQAKLIELPWDMITDMDGMRNYEGTRDGSLQFVRVTNMIELWILKSNKQDGFIDRSNWKLTRTVKLSELGIEAYDSGPEGWSSYPYFIGIDPANKCNIYLSDGHKVYSYDQDDNKTEALHAQKIEVYPADFAYFEWPIWPCL